LVSLLVGDSLFPSAQMSIFRSPPLLYKEQGVPPSFCSPWRTAFIFLAQFFAHPLPRGALIFRASPSRGTALRDPFPPCRETGPRKDYERLGYLSRVLLSFSLLRDSSRTSFSVAPGLLFVFVCARWSTPLPFPFSRSVRLAFFLVRRPLLAAVSRSPSFLERLLAFSPRSHLEISPIPNPGIVDLFCWLPPAAAVFDALLSPFLRRRRLPPGAFCLWCTWKIFWADDAFFSSPPPFLSGAPFSFLSPPGCRKRCKDSPARGLGFPPSTIPSGNFRHG